MIDTTTSFRNELPRVYELKDMLEDPTRTARRVIFVVLHFDDWVGDCPAANLFQLSFMMRAATVWEPEV